MDVKEIKVGGFDSFQSFLVYMEAHYLPLLDRVRDNPCVEGDDKRLLGFLYDDLKSLAGNLQEVFYGC
jgi:hypothetical protein